MNEQDEKTFYKGMIILGLLVRGTPINSVPHIAHELTELVIKQDDETI